MNTNVPWPPCVLEMEIELLAASEADLQARVIELETDVAVYREIALAGIDALQRMTAQHDVLRERLREQAERDRARREEALLQAGVDDVNEHRVSA